MALALTLMFENISLHNSQAGDNSTTDCHTR